MLRIDIHLLPTSVLIPLCPDMLMTSSCRLCPSIRNCGAGQTAEMFSVRGVAVHSWHKN